MKQIKKATRCKQSPPDWHAAFEAMIPTIEAHAKFSFRNFDREARTEAVQETICNCCQAYARLVELGKTSKAFPSALARFAVRQTREGRRVGGNLNILDVSSGYCQRQKKVHIERLDRYDCDEQEWTEVLVEDKHAGPADTAIVRIDFGSWLQFLPRRLRKIAIFLANGETTTAASKRFRVSQGRISQIRRELQLAWQRFQGDESTLVVA